MYFENLEVLLLLIFSFISSGKLCKWHSPIHVLEEEYFLFCCSMVQHEKGQTANWYKEKEGKNMTVYAGNRIDLNGTYLKFWPVVLNDTGKYTCCLSNGTQKNACRKRSLNVIKRNKESCFTEGHVITGRKGIVGTSYTFRCTDTLHSDPVVSITWYKNCIENISKRNEEEWHINQLKDEDAGNYTCVKTLVHARKRFNTSRTIILEVKGNEENVTPKLIGRSNEVFETDIGKQEILNCTVFLGYSKNVVEFLYELYWITDVEIDKCEKNMSPCQTEEHKYDEDGKKYAVVQLCFKNVTEEDFKFTYKCTFNLSPLPDTITFTLKKESNPDLPVGVFTTGMIMAVLFTFSAVLMVILCAAFKIELVLLFREITRKDDTLGDGKLYDAFVSYLKDSVPMCGEERTFALDILPKTLEDHFGYKLCIFERDVSPGGAVVDDVQAFIDRSRRLIIILSRNYISDKAMFELEAGLHKALVEKKIKIILIEYMPMRFFDFLPKSLDLLSSSQVVKWKKDKSLPLNSAFWKKLRYAMPAKPSAVNACQGVTPRERTKNVPSLLHPSQP